VICISESSDRRIALNWVCTMTDIVGSSLLGPNRVICINEPSDHRTALGWFSR
jgi:hypothetical protein